MIRASLQASLVVGLVGLLASCTPIRLARPLVPLEASVQAPAFPLEVVWERNLEGAVGPGAPVLAKGFAAMGTRRGDVVLVDLAEGSIEGSSSFGDSVEGRITLAPDGRRLFVPLASGRKGVVAHDLVAGRQLWRAMLGPVETAPLLMGPTLVVASLDGTVSALQTETGEVRWSHRPDTTASFRASPVPDGLDVIFADDRGRVVRRDAASGGSIWQTAIGQPVYASMAIDAGRLVIPTTRGDLLALDAATGDVLWRRTLGDGVRVGAPLVTDGLVVVGTSGGKVVALDLESGREQWTGTVEGVVTAKPAAGASVVYVGTLAQHLVALDLRSGSTVWSTTLRGRIKTDLAVVEDRLLVITEPRHLISLRTASGTL